MKQIYFKEIDSTNDYLKRNINELDDFTIVLSEKQTNGHGRHGHVWEDEGKDLLVSILFKRDSSPFELSQIFAYSVIQTLKDYHIHSSIKFPNDIFVENEKIAGILCEHIIFSQTHNTIIGLGLNINNRNHISMKSLLGIDISVTLVLNSFLLHLTENLNTPFSIILEKINEASYLKDKKLSYKHYGLVEFTRLLEDGTIEIVDEHQKIHHLLINELNIGSQIFHQ